jgi:phenylpropionate dioxygenase-like ring-hydroxylating dioxygenase large terminal subunit
MTQAIASIQRQDVSGPVRSASWLLVAAGSEVGAAPVARTVDGLPLVLFRDSGGHVVALEDRCPHKNVALSLGRVVGDTLQCRYHGWRFSTAGGLVDVPCHSPDERLPRCAVPAFPVVEQDGWIWLTLAPPGTPTGAPPRYERSPGYRWFELHNTVSAPVDLVLENGLDCSHTGFAHEGLFRSAPTQFVTAVIEETPTGVRVETLEGDTGGARDVRRTLGRGRAIRHVDEVILPHTLKVDYWIGDAAHVVTILVCTPEAGERTRLFTRMGVRYGRLLTPLVGRYVEWLTRRVVRQDLAILESQAERIRGFGGRTFRNVMADQPAAWMQRARRRYEAGERPALLRTRRVVYRL